MSGSNVNYIAYVAIVAVVGMLIILAFVFSGTSEESNVEVLDEEGNLVGEAFKVRSGVYQSRVRVPTNSNTFTMDRVSSRTLTEYDRALSRMSTRDLRALADAGFPLTRNIIDTRVGVCPCPRICGGALCCRCL